MPWDEDTVGIIKKVLKGVGGARCGWCNEGMGHTLGSEFGLK